MEDKVKRTEYSKNKITIGSTAGKAAQNKALSESKHKYKCSICLIIRDESEYLEEWLNWHIGQGVQHFYIYDHNSKYSVADFIGSLGLKIAKKVTVIEWSGSRENAQPQAYNDCLQRFGAFSKWMGFIDIDEHVRVKSGQNLAEFLDEYEHYAGLFIHWEMYGANGREHKSSSPLRQRFTKLAPIEVWSNKMGKVFVQPNLMRDMYIHNGHTVDGYSVVREHYDEIPEADNWKDNPTTQHICIDHYYTKSYEEWLEKLKRGTGHAHHSRKYSEFFEYNPEMEYCRTDTFIKQRYDVSVKQCNNESKRVKTERIKKLRKEKIAEVAKTNFLYDCSLCLIIRDENEYLEEWLNWHIGQGVEHFYIYDHGSREPVEEFVETLCDEIKNMVTVIDFSGSHKHAQFEAYNDCLKRFEKISRWIGYIDSDEMVRVNSDMKLPEFLKRYEKYAGLFMPWVVYDANGHKEKLELPCRERFTRVASSDLWPGMGKVFVQPSFMNRMMIHNGYPVEGFFVVDENESLIEEGAIAQIGVTGELICVDHYYTKSHEEWVEKMQRGSCDTMYSRKYDEFFHFNPDLIDCHLRVNLVQEYEKSKKLGRSLTYGKFKYDCSICLIIRDENEYLEEWLEWHIGQGVQHFYIYDHASKKSVLEFVQSLDSSIADMVTVVEWRGSYKNAQPDAYNDFLKRFWKESRWVGFIDVDEHVRVKTDETLPDFLDDYIDYAGLFIAWTMYDARGQKHKSSLSLRQRFTNPTSVKTWSDKMGKVFIQPRLMKDMYIHNGHPIDGYTVVGEYKDIVPENSNWKNAATTDLICVDHFYTKSYEEWLEKLKRGTGHAFHSRNYEEFFSYNPDMEYCREEKFPIQRYAVSSKQVDCAIDIAKEKKQIRKKITASKKHKEKHECSLCLIIKDESEYLEEWLKWHIGQGVEHFYIYDHASKESVSSFVKSLDVEIANKVTVIDWSGSHANAQPDAYNNCLKHFGKDNKWIGFVDADEHVRVKTGQSLIEFLKCYEQYAGVFAVWIMYDACGQKDKSEVPLRKRFPTPTAVRTWSDKMGKVFVQPKLMKSMYIHNGYPRKGYVIVGEHKDVVTEAEFWKENPTTDLICVDHYYTKSYEEWVDKIKRGRCHARHERKYEEFFEHNPDMEYCREAVFPTQEYEASVS